MYLLFGCGRVSVDKECECVDRDLWCVDCLGVAVNKGVSVFCLTIILRMRLGQLRRLSMIHFYLNNNILI